MYYLCLILRSLLSEVSLIWQLPLIWRLVNTTGAHSCLKRPLKLLGSFVMWVLLDDPNKHKDHVAAHSVISSWSWWGFLLDDLGRKRLLLLWLPLVSQQPWESSSSLTIHFFLPSHSSGIMKWDYTEAVEEKLYPVL